MLGLPKGKSFIDCLMILTELTGLICMVRFAELERSRVITSDVVQDQYSSPFSRDNLIRLKLKALKSDLWFRALSNVERALVDATIRVVDRVRSSVLAKALLSVVGKLLNASKSRVEVATKQIGLPSARRLSLLAQRWGNKTARQWMYDLSFAGFIAVMHINNPASFHVNAKKSGGLTKLQ